MVRRIASPLFVGRTGELDRLESSLGVAVDDRAAVVLVTGEAGVGKSRLVAEFIARHEADAHVLFGACVDLEAGDLPYGPFVDIFHGLSRSVDRETLGRLAGPGAAQLGPLVPDLAAGQPGIVDHGAPSRARLFEAVLSLLDRVIAERKLILIIEDLHWADRSTRDLFAFLVRSVRARGAMLVATIRTDGLARDHPIRSYLAELTRHERVEQIDLAGLGRDDTARQVAAIRGAAPDPAVLDRIVARSDGNPFIVEELLAAGLEASGVPATVRQIVMARVGERTELAQEILRTVAVDERSVGPDLLSAVVSMSERSMSRAIRQLIDHDLLTLETGGDDYRFRHALIRDAVYADVLPGERRRLHRRYAEELARLHPGVRDRARVAARVAHHWDRGGDETRAFEAYLEAALAAEEQVAHPEALEHYRRAIALRPAADLGSSVISEAELVARAAEAAYKAGEFGQAVDLALGAQAMIDPAREPLAAAIAGQRSSRAMWAASDDRAIPTLGAAVGLLSGLAPSREHASVLAEHARMLMLRSDLVRAEVSCLEALEIARATGATREEAGTVITLAVVRAGLGRVDDGVALAREGIALADRIGDVDEVARGYLNLHWILSSVGRLAEALAAAEEGAAIASRLGSEWSWGGVLIVNRAETLLYLGRWDEASELVDAMLDREPQGMIELDIRRARATLRIGRGQFDVAAQDAQRVAQLVRASDADGVALHHIVSMAFSVWNGRWKQARETVEAGRRLLAADDRHLYLPLFAATGLRAESELGALARARRNAADLATSQAIADDLIGEVRRLAAERPIDPIRDPRFAAYAALSEAEYARARAISATGSWFDSVTAFDRFGTPFEGAYARFRLAEALLAGPAADRSRAQDELRTAWATAVSLSAKPLREEIENLARRARLDLEGATEPERPAEAGAGIRPRSFGLTRREAEVLGLLAVGRTNRQIATALFVAEKTAALHVSNILAKLGAANRLEAAAIAHSAGLDQAGETGAG